MYIDCELDLKELNYELLNYLKKFEPFGIENPSPTFLTKNLEVVGFPRVVGEKHLKFKVRQKKEEKEAWEVIAFNEAKTILKLAVGKEDYLNLFKVYDLAFRNGIESAKNKAMERLSEYCKLTEDT
ncbi:MAG: hypothetical protein N2323_07350, partial [candidate division WOR-3 bacterium]|nr:hypothetical protein [candidate division WOR-3 bacterium]